MNEPARKIPRRTPLQKAVEKSNLAIIRLLLENGADVNARPTRDHGGTAFRFAAIGLLLPKNAAEHGRLDMIQLIWYASNCQLVEEQCQKAMRLAENNGHIGCRDKIVELMSMSQTITPSQVTGKYQVFSD
ncbi:ankyrin repeat-containing domain protein [Jackrogersella minutella]|nr:ankyrin repeat-containing domain protein [Jackrogersella minutella]